MRRPTKTHPTFRTLLVTLALAAAFPASLTANESSKYLDAAREFADNVLKYGRDTYGPKHTPLFVDGLNIHTHEPVKWKTPSGARWIVSNFASQQNLLRTLDALTMVTGDSKYRQAAVEAVTYALEHLQSPNGLLYWGGHIAYDALGDRISGRGPGGNHELKYHFPYYELMWQVDPKSTKRYLESLWSAHILDWSNLDMNRHGSTERTLGQPWNHEYEGGPVFFWGDGLTFLDAGSDLCYAAAMLSNLSGQEQPLVWAKRLARRYVETRNPETGIGGFQYSQCRTAFCCGPSIRGDRAQYQFGDDFKGHFVVEGTLFPCYGNTPQVPPRICQLLLGERLGAQGKEFTQWALEELTAWGKIAYRKEDNSWIPMLTDGTSMEGYVCQKDGYFGPKGRVITAGRAGPRDFWTYALAFRITGDSFMWEMARHIARGNGWGDIGTEPKTGSHLDPDTDGSSVYALLGFLELYKREPHAGLLQMARKIGDNILAARFHKGFFVPSAKHIYARFDNLEPLALLHLDAVVHARSSSIPWVWPSSSFLACEYYGRGTAYDTSLIYTLTDAAEPPMTPGVAATVGDLDELRTLLLQERAESKERQVTLNRLLSRAAEAGHAHIVEFLIAEGAQINSGTTTALHYAIQNGHRDIVKLLLAKGADVNARDGAQQTPIDIAMGRNRREIIKLLLAQGATISSIHVAAQAGDLDKVKAFLQEGVDINRVDNRGSTPLHHAAQGGRQEVAEFLIDQGADINAKDKGGYTPLYSAIWSNDANMVALLVDKGADPSYTPEKDYPPLHYAVWWENTDIARVLVDHGAKCDIRDQDGWTAFRCAADAANQDMIKLFASSGVDASGIHRAACVGDLARVTALVEQGTDVDAKDDLGWTPLYWAATMGQEKVGEFLLSKGAKADAETQDGGTPLHASAYSGAFRLAERLVSQGANVSAKNKRGRTPLHSAAAAGRRQVAELLIGKGAEVNAVDTGVRTPLHSAAVYGHANLAELLIAEGANVMATDSRERTPLQWAEEREHTEVAELLRKQETQGAVADSSDATAPDKPYVVLERGEVRAVIVNNEAVDDAVLPGHRGGYSGVASLTHRGRGENLFVPFYAGLNFEHIHDGTVQPRDILFEPRRAPMAIRQLDAYAVELYQPPTPHWKLESWLRYELLADGAIQITLECVPHARTFKNDYIGLFFASYIHQPESLDIHFLGHPADDIDGEPRWIHGVTPAHGTLPTHLSVDDQRSFAHDADFPLTLVFNRSNWRYRQPWYYGVSHGMALVLMFRPQDRVRLSQSPSGGGKGNPAWDFQWFIPNYEIGQRYRFVMRAAYVPFESCEQIIRATAAHRAALGHKSVDK